MKASNPGNVKTAMVYIIDLLVTSNDLEVTRGSNMYSISVFRLPDLLAFI